ncbi:60s ribosomal protein l25 [Moniliophthora roreri]|nr:60s ribosomal protein l25 [Moniliophthora roreri]
MSSSARGTVPSLRPTLTPHQRRVYDYQIPFPHRNPKTGRWAPPKYSLRRQAELIKKAKETNSLHLLPPGPKLHKPQVLAEVLRAKDGEGSKELPEKLKPLSFEADWVGKFTPKEKPEVPLYAQKKRMFKGHKWERTKERREAHRSMLLRDMDKRVRRWKDYHRRRRPDPLKPPKRLSGKLPF